MAQALLGEVELHYQKVGSGWPLLVINGTGGDLSRHPNPLDWVLTEHFEVVCYDHRGLGRSESLNPDIQPTMTDFAQDAARLVDHLGWDRFSLLGISFGGMVAQELALSVGRRIQRLVLACTSSGGGGGCSYPLHEVYALSPEHRVREMTALLDTRTARDEQLRRLLATVVAGSEGFAPNSRPSPGLIRQLEARRHHDAFDRLDQITAATLVAGGRYDGIAAPENSVRLTERIPNSQLALFEGGHGFFLQDPTAWPAMLAFLSDQSTSSSSRA